MYAVGGGVIFNRLVPFSCQLYILELQDMLMTIFFSWRAVRELAKKAFTIIKMPIDKLTEILVGPDKRVEAQGSNQ